MPRLRRLTERSAWERWIERHSYGAEEWRPVEGWPYEVSDRGRVRRASPAMASYQGRVLRPLVGSTGYKEVKLSNAQKRRTRSVHQLVMDSFMGPPPHGMEINHKNGDRLDNRRANLEYLPVCRNRSHRGTENPRAAITDDIVREMDALYASGYTQQALADKYGVTQAVVSKALRRDTWSHVPRVVA